MLMNMSRLNKSEPASRVAKVYYYQYWNLNVTMQVLDVIYHKINRITIMNERNKTTF